MDRNKIRKQVADVFSIFSPKKIIAREHLSNHDVREVKKKIVNNMSPINIVLATILLVVNVILITALGISSKGNIIGVYGASSLTGQIVGLAGSLITAWLIAFSYYASNEVVSLRLRRAGCGVLFITIAVQSLLCIVADAEKGFTTVTESISAAVILFVVIMLVQPAFWRDALILDLTAIISLIVTAIICHNVYGMKAFWYYVGVAVAFAICSYIVVCILFYAETQKYCQTLLTERYHNVALYDELTKCKNRSALKEYLAKRKRDWEGKPIKVLLIMFDIDNFKEYNDQFSHLGGDYCLKVITEAVRTEFAMPNLEFFRWGGEEFLIFFDLRSENEALPLLKRVRQAIHSANLDAPKGAPKDIVTISIGGHLITYREVFVFNKELAIVDEYLYKAKKAGKDVICYNGDLIISNDSNEHMAKPEKKDKITA